MAAAPDPGCGEGSGGGRAGSIGLVSVVMSVVVRWSGTGVVVSPWR